LLESAGDYGSSSIHYLNADDMSVLKQKNLDSNFFGEGCEIVKNKDGSQTVFQLTYHEGVV
jgi:glutamine cyclotransferase